MYETAVIMSIGENRSQVVEFEICIEVIIKSIVYWTIIEACSSTVVMALCYKLEGHRFKSQCGK
jgi:hypothetical protein